MTTLEADRAEINRFVTAAFLHADRDNFASLRAFRDDADGTWRYEEWSTVRIGDTLDALVEAAFRFSGICAAADEPVCFAPPIATFNSPDKADQASLANGLVISAELDSAPERARDKLEQVLGQATIVMQSGGLWSDPETGKIEQKLHLHWRLAKPTKTKIEHDFLRECNQLACRLAGGDPTAISLVHPLRWAGSWHKKAAPRLARIIAFNPAAELTLADALSRLRATVKRQEPKSAGNGAEAHRSSEPQADPLDIAAALAVIPNDDLDWDQWNAVGMATWRASDGSETGYAAFAAWSGKSRKFDPATTRARWAHFSTSPPTQIGAGTLFHMAKAARPDFVKPSTRARGEPPVEDDTDWASPPLEEPWPDIEAEAFHGIAGEIVDAINPHTEADPVAVLAQLLAVAGNALGHQAHCRVGDTRHHTNLYTVICGDTAKGRKGTSYDPVENLIGRADPDWTKGCVKSGLASGEGIIHAVHDDIWVREKVPQGGKGRPPIYEWVLKEPNVEDKRLLVIEQELAALLGVMQRQGNSVSPVLRLGWDGRKLQTLAKTSGEVATGAHVSVIGHITIDELRARLDQISMANGFGNRFLFVLAKRSKELPFPGRLDDGRADHFAARLGGILTSTVLRHAITFRSEARDLWIAEYHDLSAAKPGLFGFLVARAEAQVLRLAMIYALLHETYYIEAAHLRAALAFWRYCEASARYVFGDMLGDVVADDLLDALRQAGPVGRTRNELREQFQHHSRRLGQALALLAKHGKARMQKRTGTGGRAAEVWIAT